MEKTTIQTIDDYIATFTDEIQEKLEAIRFLIKDVVPAAVEKISYGMPTFILHGNLVHFAAYKSHIGFYPTSSAIEAFQHELSAYKSAKGSVQFPLDEPIPFDLIRKMVEFRVSENMAKAKQVKTKRKVNS